MKSKKAFDTHNNFLPYVLNKVTDKLNSEFLVALRKYKITLTQWRVLAFLNESDGLGVSALADFTVTDQSTLSRSLQQLEKRKLIRRATGQVDTRFVEIHISEAGRNLFSEIIPIAKDLRNQVISAIGRTDADRLLLLLNKLLCNFNPDPRRQK